MSLRNLFITILLFCPQFLYAQQAEKPFWLKLKERDSVNNTYTCTDYVPFTMQLLDGTTLSNNSLKGKVTLLAFWFIGCHGCHFEYPILNKIYHELGNDSLFRVYAVTFDNPKRLPEYIADHNMQYPIATVESQKDAHAMNYGNAFPTNVLIDENGKVILVWMKAISYEKDDASAKDNIYPFIHDALKKARNTNR